MVIRRVSETITRASQAISDAVPTLARDVEIPVYLVHNSPDPEDYFFLLDFEAFERDAKAGLFTRPVLKIWAGRSDFRRSGFARQFREVFAAEFGAMRAKAKAKRGWFSFGMADLAEGALTNFVGTLVLYVAVSTGRAAVSALAQAFSLHKLLGPLAPKDRAARVEADIAEKTQTIDAALEEISIVLHLDLYRHAWKGQPPGKLTGVDYDAWPLPDYVQDRLKANRKDGKSSAWW